MGGYGRYPVRLVIGVSLLMLVALVVGCSTGDPQNTFAPAGDVARKERDLFNIVLWPLVGIFVVVEGALLFALLWFRRRRGREIPKQVHGNTRLEVAWTIAPTLFLLALAIPTIAAIIDLAEPPKGDVLEVAVTGRQWSWRFEYPEYKIVTTNELFIPVGKTIQIKTSSPDVIHSFWVPRLAGKIDIIPGRTTGMWFNATEPGTYSGQCAEFCGLSHWEMRFTVKALPEEEFQAWVNEQQAAKPGQDRRQYAWQPEE